MGKSGARVEARGTRKRQTPAPVPHIAEPRPWVALVTRPAHQAEGLAHKIEAAGGRAIRWPALEIQPPSNTLALDHLAARLAHAEIAIFISPNAVEQAAARVPPAEWPHHLLLAAVGAGTARALRAVTGRHADLCPPEPYDSEGLLALAELQSVAGRRILIVRGEGGRERLADTLRTRGAAVEYAEVYRRACPEAAPAAARSALAEGRVDVVTVTSVEALHNLLRTAGDLAGKLRALPLVVVSERMAREAQESGFTMPVLTARAASDEALVEALLEWVNGRE